MPLLHGALTYTERRPKAPVRFWNAAEKTLLRTAHTPHPDFVTDQNGKRKAVILSLEDYQELLDDLDDLAVVAEQQSEETISQAELERELERDTYRG